MFEDPRESVQRNSDTASEDKKNHALTKGFVGIVMQEPDLAWSQIKTGGGDQGKIMMNVLEGFGSGVTADSATHLLTHPPTPQPTPKHPTPQPPNPECAGLWDIALLNAFANSVNITEGPHEEAIL